MKAIIIVLSAAGLLMSVSQGSAHKLNVNVVKTKIPEGCEYKKVPGKKQKQLICIDDLQNSGGGGGTELEVSDIEREPLDDGPPNGFNGNSKVEKGANNGFGNTTDSGTNPPGGSAKKFDPNSTDNR